MKNKEKISYYTVTVYPKQKIFNNFSFNLGNQKFSAITYYRGVQFDLPDNAKFVFRILYLNHYFTIDNFGNRRILNTNTINKNIEEIKKNGIPSEITQDILDLDVGVLKRSFIRKQRIIFEPKKTSVYKLTMYFPGHNNYAIKLKNNRRISIIYTNLLNPEDYIINKIIKFNDISKYTYEKKEGESLTGII